MRKFGIDISKWQKGLSLAQAQKEGVQFAILKAGGSDAGHYKDACFESFYLQAKTLGMPVGAYYFGRDLTVGQAEASAEHFIELLSCKQFEYPVYIDLEAPAPSTRKGNTDATIGFRYSPGETYMNTKQERWVINYDAPVIKMQHSFGIRGLLGGDYNYNYTELEIDKRFWLPMSLGSINTRIRLGAQWN